MAYVHCHNCNWSQSDFHTFRFPIILFSLGKFRPRIDFGFNIVSKCLDSILWLWKPRWIGIDKWHINDLSKHLGYSYKTRERMKTDVVKGDKFSDPNEEIGSIKQYKVFEVFSWSMLKNEIKKHFHNLNNMYWLTYDEWKRDPDRWVCPKCGQKKLDID